jgi:hypothetical protein
MRRFALAVVLALSAGSARAADTYVFPTLRVARGYQGPIVVDVTWSDGTPRPVAPIVGVLTVYRSSSTPGSTGAVLLQKAIDPAGGTEPANRMVINVSSADLSAPGTYYAEIQLVEALATDMLHGLVTIEGQRVPGGIGLLEEAPEGEVGGAVAFATPPEAARRWAGGGPTGGMG